MCQCPSARDHPPSSFCLDKYCSFFLFFSFFSALLSSCSVGNFVSIPSLLRQAIVFLCWSRHSNTLLKLSFQALQASWPSLTYSLAHASPILFHLNYPRRRLSASQSGVRSTDIHLALPLPSPGEWEHSPAAIYHANGADYSDVRGMTIFWEPSDVDCSATGPVTETCTFTFTPVTGPNGEPLVEVVRACTVTAGAPPPPNNPGSTTSSPPPPPPPPQTSAPSPPATSPPGSSTPTATTSTPGSSPTPLNPVGFRCFLPFD